MIKFSLSVAQEKMTIHEIWVKNKQKSIMGGTVIKEVISKKSA